MPPHTKPRPITRRDLPLRVRDLVDRVCAAHGVPVHQVLSRSRRTHLTLARWTIWAEMRTWTTSDGEPWSYPRIGGIFHADHTSIMHGVKRLAIVTAPERQREYEMARGARRVALWRAGIVEEPPLDTDVVLFERAMRRPQANDA